MKPRSASITVQVNGAKTRHEQFDGRDHLVAPVVAVKEGVLNGMLLLFEEFSAYPQAWEGIPLPVNHPMKGNMPITANSPDVLSTSVIGRFHNVNADEGKKALAGELWIDVEKAKAHAKGPQIMQTLETGGNLEVSTAYFTDIEDGTGVFNGEQYNGIQRNLRPDHLALLPDAVGACSWDDGCGAPRVAQKMFVNEAEHKNDRNQCRATFNAASDISFDEQASMIRAALNAEDPGSYHWLADVFDDFVVYEKEPRTTAAVASPSPSMMFKRGYAIKKEKVKLGEATNVRRRISYVEVPATNKQVNSEEQKIMDKKLIVDALIADDKTPWKETHRDSLMTLSECELNGLKTQAAPPAPPKAPEPPAPAANAGEPKKEEPKTAQDWLKTIPDPRLKAMFEQGLQTHDARKATLVKDLTANKSCAFSKEELEGMELSFLEKVSATLGVNYEGAGRPRTSRQADIQDNDADGVPEPPKVLTAPIKAKE